MKNTVYKFTIEFYAGRVYNTTEEGRPDNGNKNVKQTIPQAFGFGIYRQLDIKLELDLHEWMPDLTFQYSTWQEAEKAIELCKKYKGVCPDTSEIKFENIGDIFKRAKKALSKYTEYRKIIVVTHVMVIKCFSSISSIPYCGILEIDFDESYPCSDYVF